MAQSAETRAWLDRLKVAMATELMDANGLLSQQEADDRVWCVLSATGPPPEQEQGSPDR